MKHILPRALALAAIVVAGHASAAITLFSHDGFHGKRVTLVQPAPDFRDFNFNDRASSIVVEGEPWEVCQDVGFRNRCAILVPGDYPNLAAVGLGDTLSSARPAHREPPPPPPPPVLPPPQATGDVVFFEHPGFRGRSLGTSSQIDNLVQYGFNDRASSVVVFEHRWEICEHSEFGGRCMILRPGRYPDLRSMGMNDLITSVRRIRHEDNFEDSRYAPQPQPAYDWRRRPQEYVEAVPIESVHVVYAAPQQQCWVEQSAAPANARTGGAIVGGLIGGILGHQIGGNGDRTATTAGGAVAGAVIGSQLARGADQPQQVTRCTSVPSQAPDHYDIAYWYHGVQHHVQTTQP
ncbi:MAG: glycine zipper 2TM domain-containing protein, partial [Burkholderiales bacterium]|nr:glycine zipper 2TM domain-containing protein [Burkholderiales bacterium]